MRVHIDVFVGVRAMTEKHGGKKKRSKDIADDVVAAKATNSKSRSLTLFVIDGKKLFPGRTVRMAAAGGRLQAAE